MDESIITPAALGAALRRARKAADLTQAQLAETAAVSRRLIIDIEAGKPRVELQGVLAALEALGLALALVPGPGGEPSSELDVEVPW